MPASYAEAAQPQQARSHWRLPIVAVAVFGLGGLVALSVGLTLYLGLSAAERNTSELLVVRSRSIVDELEAELHATLDPVVAQAHWIAERVSSGEVDLSETDSLDTFVTGAFAATPQVAGIGIVTPEGEIRRWGRVNNDVVTEDWSNRPEIVRWLAEVHERDAPAWSPPLWTHTLSSTVVFHDFPLHHEGRFVGVLAQVVPIAALSRRLQIMQRTSFMVPFVLYGGDQVLAHPLLAHSAPGGSDERAPLPRLSDLGDTTLQRLLTFDEVPFYLRTMRDVKAAGGEIAGSYHVLLQRDLVGYGERPWRIGVHFDADSVAGAVPERIILALWIGVALLLLTVAVALIAGRRLTAPVQRLAEAAEAVRAGHFEDAPVMGESRVRELDVALNAFREMVDGLRERHLVLGLLGRFVPESVAHRLLADGGSLPAQESEATLLFCDLERFTELTERVGASATLTLLNEYFEAMVQILERHGGVVTQFQGDAILATFNVPLPSDGHPEAALRAAIEMQQVVRSRRFAGERLACRIGINTGSVVAGAAGAKGRSSYTVHGDAVNLAARLESMNKAYGTRILVAAATADRVEGFDLRRVGELEVRGRLQPVTVYALDVDQADD